MNITRQDIVENLNKQWGLPWRQTTDVVDGVVDILVDSLVREHDIKITNFGTFAIRQKKQRIGRNPKTGVTAIIAPRKTISFNPTNKVKKIKRRP